MNDPVVNDLLIIKIVGSGEDIITWYYLNVSFVFLLDEFSWFTLGNYIVVVKTSYNVLL